jgi:HEAT repeat protein
MVGACKEFLKLNIFVLIFIATMGTSIAADMNKIISDLQSTDRRTRLSAVEELGKIRDEESFNLLLNVADTRMEYWPVKIKAITLLGEIGNPRAIDVLLKIFNDTFLNSECPSIKSYTAQALGNFPGDTRVVDALITGLNNPEILTREASIRSLGKIRNPKAVLYLLPLLSDSSIALKLSAIKALEDIGDTSAVPHLQRVAENDSDPVVRSVASSALKNFNK